MYCNAILVLPQIKLKLIMSSVFDPLGNELVNNTSWLATTEEVWYVRKQPVSRTMRVLP
jgi:hypothetical protein